MYKLCKSEQSARRQRQLEIGLLRAMERKRYEDISISDLCQQMEIPRKSFYRYFSGKDGALHGLIDHTLMEYQAYDVAKLADARSLMMDLEKYFRFWQSKKELLDALFRSDLSGVLLERAVAYAMSDEVFPARFLPGETKQAQKHIVMFAVCGLISMVMQWHADGFQDDPRELARIACRMLSQPLFPNIGGLL